MKAKRKSRRADSTTGIIGTTGSTRPVGTARTAGSTRPVGTTCIAGTPPGAPVRLPCCILLGPASSVSPDAAGVLLARTLEALRPGCTAVSILAHALPPPSDLGDFDSYQGLLFIPDLITWTFILFPTAETPPTWAGTFTEITATLTANAQAQVRPVNRTTGQTGAPVLAGLLRRCCPSDGAS